MKSILNIKSFNELMFIQTVGFVFFMSSCANSEICNHGIFFSSASNSQEIEAQRNRIQEEIRQSEQFLESQRRKKQEQELKKQEKQRELHEKKNILETQNKELIMLDSKAKNVSDINKLTRDNHAQYIIKKKKFDENKTRLAELEKAILGEEKKMKEFKEKLDLTI